MASGERLTGNDHIVRTITHDPSNPVYRILLSEKLYRVAKIAGLVDHYFQLHLGCQPGIVEIRMDGG